MVSIWTVGLLQRPRITLFVALLISSLEIISKSISAGTSSSQVFPELLRNLSSMNLSERFLNYNSRLIYSNPIKYRGALKYPKKKMIAIRDFIRIFSRDTKLRDKFLNRRIMIFDSRFFLCSKWRSKLPFRFWTFSWTNLLYKNL